METRIGYSRGLDEHKRTPTPAEPGRVDLRPGEHACAGCGAVTTGQPVESVILDRGGPTGLYSVPLGRCGPCGELWERAEHIATPNSFGAAVAAVARGLYVFAALGMAVPDRIDAAEVLRWFGRFEIDWASRLHQGTEDPRTAAARPWSHVAPEVRAILVEQYSRWMHTRARPGRPLRIPAPRMGGGRPGGCVMCGLGWIEIAADEAADHYAPGMWRSVSIDPSTIGGTGQRVDGVLCTACDAACAGHDGRRVLGPSAVERAVANHWEALGFRAEASLVRHGELRVTGWAAAPREPNETPWQHVAVPELG